MTPRIRFTEYLDLDVDVVDPEGSDDDGPDEDGA